MTVPHVVVRTMKGKRGRWSCAAQRTTAGRGSWAQTAHSGDYALSCNVMRRKDVKTEYSGAHRNRRCERECKDTGAGCEVEQRGASAGVLEGRSNMLERRRRRPTRASATVRRAALALDRSGGQYTMNSSETTSTRVEGVRIAHRRRDASGKRSSAWCSARGVDGHERLQVHRGLQVA